MALSNNPLVTAGGGGSGANVAGYVGEVNFFADSELRENHVWADGTTFDETAYPDLKEYAQANNWKQDSSGNYLTPILTGSVSGNYSTTGIIFCQIRAKVDVITMSVASITNKTLSGFTNGDILIQKNGKVGSISSDELAITEWEQGTFTPNTDNVPGLTVVDSEVLYNQGLSLLYIKINITYTQKTGPFVFGTINNIPSMQNPTSLKGGLVVVSTDGQYHVINTTISASGEISLIVGDSTITQTYVIDMVVPMAKAGGEWPAIGEKKYLAVAKASGGSGENSIEVVWNNTAPTEQFAPQIVPCNSENFDSIAIKCKVIGSADSTIVYIPTIQQENETIQIMCYANGGIVYRDVTFSPTALTFGNGYKISTLGPNTIPDIDNSFIPTTIYGIVGGGQSV